MDWIPIVLVTFKAIVLGTGMFFAIKWHYDQGKKDKQGKRATPGAVGKIAAVFAVSLLVLVLFTLFLSKNLGLDLTFP